MPSLDQKTMDVVFLIDATGSMAAMIKGAHDKAAELATELRKKSSEIDFRFGCVCYRDPIDVRSDVHQVHGLNSDIQAMVRFLEGVKASGGGDCPEDWVGAYEIALHQIQWRTGGKTIIHMADAPAHGSKFGGPGHEEEGPKLVPLIEETAREQIVISAMDIWAQASKAFAECKVIYDKCQGPGYDIQVFTPKVEAGSPGSGDRFASLARVSAHMGGQMRMQTMQACEQAIQCRYTGKF
jgi:hypothetical protein